MSDRIDALARRVVNDPHFLASVLWVYARSEGVDDEDLAGMLGCPVSTLAPLALCRRPRPEPPFFQQDVERIAQHFGIRPETLAEIVRRADALAALQRGAEGDRGFLMAARDATEEVNHEENRT